MPTVLLWREIEFGGLEEELAAIDDYAAEEKLEESDPWPRFLRGAAYEHWGRPSLALAQYDTVNSAKGLRMVPELYLRKAYNAFKVGEVATANALHDVAKAISIAAVGNQLHFSYWFEKNFADFKPRHNGPPFSAQRGICKYCSGFPVDARGSLAPAILARTGPSEGIGHICLWFLASCAKLVPVSADSGPAVPSEGDLKVARDVLAADDLVEDLVPLASLYMGTASVGEVETFVRAAGEDEFAMIRAVYLALYHDAYAGSSAKRDEWLDVALAAPRSDCAHDVNDFVYHAAKNRFSIPTSPSPPPVIEIPVEQD
jgi:hypothetical protein